MASVMREDSPRLNALKRLKVGQPKAAFTQQELQHELGSAKQ